MAITTNDAVWKYGTQDEVTVASPSSISDGSFSSASDVTAWVNDDDASLGTFVLNAAWSSAPTAAGTVSLFARLQDIVGTNDMPVVDANFQQLYLGEFVVDNVGGSTELYLVLPDVVLPSAYTSQSTLFYIKNNSGQTINSGWDLYVTPKSYGPA